MPQTPSPIDANELRELVGVLPPTHPLRGGTESYREGFIAAFTKVHGNNPTARKRLEEEFFVPCNRTFSEKVFGEHAAELSVANHVALKGPAEFETDRRMNPSTNKRDVDVFYRIGATKVALEVKCPDEKAKPSGQPTLDFAGRHPDPKGILGDLRSVFAGAANLPDNLKDLQLAQHNDNKLKDYLVLSHGKFSESSDLDQLNVLLLACGDELQPWIHYLYEREGLFTPQSYWPVEQFERTQVVLLSNLRYFHSTAAAHHDWTLRNVFLLPFFNPRAARVPMSETRAEGLSVFDHHGRAYTAFAPSSADPRVPDDAMRATKLNHYVHGALSDEDFARFFPATKRRPKKL
jgi:hypothetical protein